MIAAAMESKRLGLCNKSLFVVPNHIIEQFASEFMQLYPSANILVTSKKDFAMNNRKKFCSKIATGEYDAIIMGHSQFEKIQLSQERQAHFLNQQIYDLTLSINDLRKNGGEYYSIKQLEKSKKKVEEKLKKLNEKGLTIINITSDLETIYDSNKVYLLNNKSIEELGNVEQVFQEDNYLRKLGFKIPFIIDLSIKLKFYGLLDKIYYNLEALEENLWN